MRQTIHETPKTLKPQNRNPKVTRAQYVQYYLKIIVLACGR